MKPLYSTYIHTLSTPLTFILYLLRWKRKVVLQNLTFCNLAPPQSVSRETFLLGFYKNISKDFLLFLHRTPAQSLWLHPKDKSKLSSFIQSGGILLTGHYHNWELLGSFLRKQGLPLVGAYKPLQSPFWNKVLLALRKNIHLPTISDNIPKHSKSWVESGGTFGMLLDQHQEKGLSYPFFGQPVLSSKLPYFLLKNTKSPFYAIFLQKNHRVRIVKLWNKNKLDTHEISCKKIYSRYHATLECLIRQDPHLWYGLAHKRFKNTHKYP